MISNNIENEEHKNSIEYDELGNIKNLDVPDYNIITKDDSISVVKAKQKVQLDQYYNKGCFAKEEATIAAVNYLHNKHIL